MEDRELLELAAKAAGIVIANWSNAQAGGFQSFESAGGRFWNPLNDHGDALRLAVKLHMSLDMFTGGCEVGFDDQQGGEGFLEQDDGEEGELDDCALTCRAIVRAAAEIGKAMQVTP